MWHEIQASNLEKKKSQKLFLGQPATHLAPKIMNDSYQI